MKTTRSDSAFQRTAFAFLLLLATSAFLSAADVPNFTGEYADKKFLNGQAVFQLSLEQKGNSVDIFFAAGYNDGHGIAPETNCKGKVNAKGTVEFKFVDSDGNAGAGTIARAGYDVIVSIKATTVRDQRALVFYRDGIRLTQANKK
jgi:hypothetical protein